MRRRVLRDACTRLADTARPGRCGTIHTCGGCALAPDLLPVPSRTVGLTHRFQGVAQMVVDAAKEKENFRDNITVAVIPCAPQAGVVAEGAMETPEPPRAGGCWSAGSMPRGRD